MSMVQLSWEFTLVQWHAKEKRGGGGINWAAERQTFNKKKCVLKDNEGAGQFRDTIFGSNISSQDLIPDLETMDLFKC